MAQQGRNQRCACGSGRKVKFCCGVRRGPSDTEMAKAFLAGLLRPAAAVLAACSNELLDELLDEVAELPRLDSSMQVPLPRLVTPELDVLLAAVERRDSVALRRAIPAVMARVDTPLERARLARAVMGLGEAGRIPALMEAMALFDLASPKMDTLVTMGLVQSAAVALGAERTPGGLLLAG